MADNDVYEKFVQWLKKSWFGVPDSKHMMDAVKATYSPEDAAFLIGMPYKLTSLKELSSQRQMEESELEPLLNRLAVKGLIWKSVGEKGTYYSMNDLFFVIMRSSFWGGKEDDLTKNIAVKTNQYYYDGLFSDLNEMSVGGLRTVPIETTVEDTRAIKSYEDVVTLVDEFDYHTVSVCPCRQRKKLDPDYEESKLPSEVCLHFDDLGRYIVECGMGREITKEETKEILLKSAKAGLVHGVSNWEQKPDTI